MARTLPKKIKKERTVHCSYVLASSKYLLNYKRESMEAKNIQGTDGQLRVNVVNLFSLSIISIVCDWVRERE